MVKRIFAVLWSLLVLAIVATGIYVITQHPNNLSYVAVCTLAATLFALFIGFCFYQILDYGTRTPL
jgi:uncharacterized membrane protein